MRALSHAAEAGVHCGRNDFEGGSEVVDASFDAVHRQFLQFTDSVDKLVRHSGCVVEAACNQSQVRLYAHAIQQASRYLDHAGCIRTGSLLSRYAAIPLQFGGDGVTVEWDGREGVSCEN